MKEYDIVRLINDRDSYIKKHIKKGMVGIVFGASSTNDKILVSFSKKIPTKDGGTIEDIEIIIHKEDLERLDKWPEQ